MPKPFNNLPGFGRGLWRGQEGIGHALPKTAVSGRLAANALGFVTLIVMWRAFLSVKWRLTVAALQDLIERGSLEPGSMVSERSLIELTGFGRTPVREAIQRLALSHMLRIHPNRGIEIPAASVEDQLSRLDVRRATEVL